MQITAKIEAKRVRQSVHNIGQALPKLGKRDLRNAMQSAQYEASGDWSGDASYSVPPPPNSNYTRAGTYGASFELRSNTGVSYTLISDAVSRYGAHYTPYVGGGAYGSGQAEIHQGRWPIIADVVRKWIETLTQSFSVTMSRLFRQEGIGL